MTGIKPKPTPIVSQKDIEDMPPMVRWFDPSVLLKILRPVVVSGVFGTYADKRLIQAALDKETDAKLFARADLTKKLGADSDGSFWFDFIADTGDGFDSTYTIAWLQAQDALKVENQETKRGKLLLIGGDLVYPDAKRENYENKFRKPYAWALPEDGSAERGRPQMYAIPGNHDWYDGLDLFLAYFCGKKPWKIGYRRANQRRSYFALQLAKDLWIWGVDIQLSDRVDQPQAEYFRAIAKKMDKGSSIVVCTAVPGWYDPEGNPFGSLGYFATIARETERDLKIPLVLSGDTHHYCRYIAEDGTQFITSGGGGAFLHPTHTLKKKNSAWWGAKTQNITLAQFKDAKNQTMDSVYPSADTSLRLLCGLRKSPIQNWKLSGMLGALYGVSSLTAIMWNDLSWDWSLLSNLPLWLWLAIFIGIFYGYADKSEWVRNGKSVVEKPKYSTEATLVQKLYDYRKLLLGTLHGTLHFLAAILFASIFYNGIIGVCGIQFWTWSYNLSFALAATVLGGFIGGVIFALYLYFTCRVFSINANDAFSAQALDSYRNFLRLRYSKGKLTVYPIGVDTVVPRRQWKATGFGDRRPRVAPDRPIEIRLIEGPIEISVA